MERSKRLGSHSSDGLRHSRGYGGRSERIGNKDRDTDKGRDTDPGGKDRRSSHHHSRSHNRGGPGFAFSFDSMRRYAKY